ncbi:hypothetical protein [Lentisalinibacter salinarum]|uniref:hypothetical protein n=1 Tax=Lentisalinibacter salinarum TaxID=2992239 RepID=UPI00386D764A
MGSAYTIRAGGSGGEVDRGTNVVKCGSSGAHTNESSCPNDALYTPAEATGGYQAWGVGIAYVDLSSTTTECMLQPYIVFDISGNYYTQWRVVCREIVISSPVKTLGMAIAKVKWGESITGTSTWSNRPTSVLGFKESLLTPCLPFFNPSNGDVDCANGLDSAYVSDSGYEIDIVIPDPSCDTLLNFRYHDSRDTAAGCFTYYQHAQTSNLPAAYQDTTYSDDEETLLIGFGSASGVSIAPGVTYIVRQLFSSHQQPPMDGKTASHVGAITTEFEAFCLFGSSNPEHCFFGVDTASVGGTSRDFSVVTPP